MQGMPSRDRINFWYRNKTGKQVARMNIELEIFIMAHE
jgi:hypothetical protein